MTLTEVRSARGGAISIHFGKEMVSTNLWDRYGWYEITDPSVVAGLREIERAQKRLHDVEKVKALAQDLLDKYPSPEKIGRPLYKTLSKATFEMGKATITVSAPPSPPAIEETAPTEKPAVSYDTIKVVMRKILDFFSEFTFDPSVRFVNTLSHCKNYTLAKEYIENYLSLEDHPDKNSIVDKIKSDEFKSIYNDLHAMESDNHVNKRFVVYYGPAGGGKTTAVEIDYPETKGRATLCNATIDPDDTMRHFEFDKDGNPIFFPTALIEDMENGRPHAMDEINLLPYNTLRSLQCILDNKEQFEYKGKTIHIKDGFKLIGTMNLFVNGQAFSLPEPLVDRAETIKFFPITEDLLARYAL